MSRPELLIEKWLPIEELGIESQRERGASSALPPLNFLHVWWARRPLTASRAAVLGSVLPAWNKDWPKGLLDKFPTNEEYQDWFLWLVGILGDPVSGQKLIRWAKENSKKLKANPYGYDRAFTKNPSQGDLENLYDLIEFAWDSRDITFADPMSGGGSIPFEALRYGLTTFASELNPVAMVVLKATLDYPARFGPDLAKEISEYGNRWIRQVVEKLEPFYPLTDPKDSIYAYIWARTVACPVTRKPVPLSPNWWLQKPKNAPIDKLVAAKLLCDPIWDECRFEIVNGQAAVDSRPSEGTVSRGTGLSPWTGDAIDGRYIKSEAQAGRMGQQLYTLAIKRDRSFSFRTPTEEDSRAFKKAERELEKKLPEWLQRNIVPSEPIIEGNKTSEPLRYGVKLWRNMFSPRQLLALGTFIETLTEIKGHIRAELPEDKANAVITYLSSAFNKTANYNSCMVRWHSGRSLIAGTFDRHDFSFKWSHAEYDAARNLLPWALDQILDAYKGIAKLAESAKTPMFSVVEKPVVDRLRLRKGNAANLEEIADESIKVIVVDPPYKANVMYAECSDFFYVWMKRTLGDVYPEFFAEELTDKDTEAVSNVARFTSFKGKKRTQLAERDYENKMTACFKEMYRVLDPDGVLTVMFTHKEVSAWDSLGSALINAGFIIKASWPVSTESEHSLHQAKKNAANSTIFLVCRKRAEEESETVWWDDLKSKVRTMARSKAEEFEKRGIRGVDLYISTFGPVLSLISEQWPVLTSETDEDGNPIPLRPEEALDIAREEIVTLRKRGLLLGRDIRFDPTTDWYLLAWDAFKAEKFKADEARKLALALGLSLEQDLIKTNKVVSKDGQFVVVKNPTKRRQRNKVDPELKVFDTWLDAVHTAMLVYDEDGSKACEAILKKTGFDTNPTFKACIQAMINAIPRTKKKDKFVRPEAETLENIRLAFFDDIEAPPEEEPVATQLQRELKGFKGS